MFGRKKIKNVRGFRKHEIKIINKPVYDNPYYKRKNPGFILRLFKNPRRIITVLIALGVIYFFFYSSYFRINTVEIQGNLELTYDQIRYEVNKPFAARRLIFFRQSNFFIYNKKAAEKALWDTFVLEKVDIRKKLPNKIIVTLKEKIPNLTLINQNRYYYLDREGIVTHSINQAEVKPNFPIVEDLNERNIKLKDQILSKEMIEAIFTLNEKFNSKTNTGIDRFLIPVVHCPKKIESEDETDNQLNSNSNSNSNS